MDRNLDCSKGGKITRVALLAEGVDRNFYLRPKRPGGRVSPSSRRAWIEIGVMTGGINVVMSPSSRRAWIEILTHRLPHGGLLVALLAEGVDRNCYLRFECEGGRVSPSSRRAWIEMEGYQEGRGSVQGRPPRGGRG